MGLFSSLFGNKQPQEEQKSKQEKKNFEILKYDGIRARNMHQLPYAIKCLEQALTLDEDIETLQYLASCYAESDRIEDARLTLNRLIEKEPDNIHALLSLANLCYLQEDYPAMDEACQKAIEKDSSNATAYYLAAKAARALKNDIQAVVMLTKAIQQQEDYPAAYLLRAEVLWDMRQANEAMDDLEKVLASIPEDEDALTLKGQILAAGDKTEESINCFNLIIGINPFNEKAYLLKGEILAGQKNFDAVIGLYTEALELMPDNARLYQERGRARLLQGDKDGSVEDMKKAIELNPDSEKQISGNYDNFNQNSVPGIY
ncbi:tetratricopeptide repeat protein [uncultured Bacteroides sp.]|uniref:tetratricopeptide repeat protein n=1 Tax=uncultured Bacteroides sp. TaxID=162156 RepID=UPI002605231E|nr:tetratricopeptide repeat protein [uncultured Bacteroides sp.]